MNIEHRLSKAKTALVLAHPFIGTVALNLKTVITESVPTAGTDGKVIYYNPEFIGGLTDAEVMFLVAHECLHPMLEHNYRRGQRDAERWNIAADFVINQLLSDEGIGTFIKGGCLDKSTYDKGGGTSEGIYNILPKQPTGKKSGKGRGAASSGVPGIGRDIIDASGSPAEVEQAAAEMRVKVAQAAQAARMAGKLSARMNQLVSQILQPKVNWRDVLQRFVVKCRDDSRTWSRPNRRFLPQSLYMPSRTGEALGPLVIAVDCSGSVSDLDIAQFAGEITAIHTDLRPSAVHVVYFDADVLHCDTFAPEDTLHFARHGGGGTAFSPIFKYVDEQQLNPVACVVLTDLCSDDFGRAPDYPVLWVSTYSDRAPFGEVTTMR